MLSNVEQWWADNLWACLIDDHMQTKLREDLKKVR